MGSQVEQGMNGSEGWAVRAVGDGISLEVETVDGTSVTVSLEVDQARLLALDLHWACQHATAATGELKGESENDEDLVRLVGQLRDPCTKRRRR